MLLRPQHSLTFLVPLSFRKQTPSLLQSSPSLILLLLSRSRTGPGGFSFLPPTLPYAAGWGLGGSPRRTAPASWLLLAFPVPAQSLDLAGSIGAAAAARGEARGVLVTAPRWWSEQGFRCGLEL